MSKEWSLEALTGPKAHNATTAARKSIEAIRAITWPTEEQWGILEKLAVSKLPRGEKHSHPNIRIMRLPGGIAVAFRRK